MYETVITQQLSIKVIDYVGGRATLRYLLGAGNFDYGDNGWNGDELCSWISFDFTIKTLNKSKKFVILYDPISESHNIEFWTRGKNHRRISRYEDISLHSIKPIFLSETGIKL